MIRYGYAMRMHSVSKTSGMRTSASAMAQLHPAELQLQSFQLHPVELQLQSSKCGTIRLQ